MRTNRFLLVLVGAALTIPLAACGDDDDDDTAAEPAGEETTTSTADPYGGGTDTATTGGTAPAAGGVVLNAVLSGAEEVPGPGLADGKGGAELTFKAGEVCYVLNVAMGEDPTATHIHQGAKGASGAVVVNLMPTFTHGEATHDAEGCAKPEQAVLDSITANPAGFYVNVHTAEHPDGAVRGQLASKA